MNFSQFRSDDRLFWGIHITCLVNCTANPNEHPMAPGETRGETREGGLGHALFSSFIELAGSESELNTLVSVRAAEKTHGPLSL